MSPKRILLIPALLLLLYLGMYSWNQRTHALDNVATHTGLEIVGTVLKGVRFVERSVIDTWDRYLDLVNVRAENERLKAQLMGLNARLVLAAEDRAELARLRALLLFTPPDAWRAIATRVLAGRMGGNAVLATVTIDNGYLSGAVPGTPVVANGGIVGRVFRAGPLTATVLLLEDPGHRVAVLTQEGRVPGILVGAGALRPLEVRFVSHNAKVEAGETLVTSGLDGLYPKGLPVARVVSALPSGVSPFQAVIAEPLVIVEQQEELLLLERHETLLEVPSVFSVPTVPPVLEAPQRAQRAKPAPRRGVRP